MAATVAPFRVEVSDATLDDLRRRLDGARFPSRSPAPGGTTAPTTPSCATSSSTGATATTGGATEARLNRLEHGITDIDGQSVHFLHVRSPVPGALPLVLTHGWPGSIVEFLDVIGPLADPAAHGGQPGDAFHVVCPSLPGYAFSGPTHDRGWDPGRIARAWAELMRRLDYRQYGAQGGDWGSFVTSQLALATPSTWSGSTST